MTKEETQRLLYKIDSEGFDYCFTNYSSWNEIDDEKFQKTLSKYVKAQSNLAAYIEENRIHYDIEEI